MSETILFGATGKLGREYALQNPGILTPDRNEVNLLSPETAYQYVTARKPHTVIHTAAIVGQREAEFDRDQTYTVNVKSTQAIAKACRDIEARMVYISSVAVFDGKKGLYRETDTPSPDYYYGWTKLLGEVAVGMVPQHQIIRTDFFRTDGLKYPKAFSDHFCSKLPVQELVKAIQKLLATNYSGIVHVGSPRDTLLKILKPYYPDIEGIQIKDSTLPDFPQDLSLDTTLYKQLTEDEKN